MNPSAGREGVSHLGSWDAPSGEEASLVEASRVLPFSLLSGFGDRPRSPVQHAFWTPALALKTSNCFTPGRKAEFLSPLIMGFVSQLIQ